MIHLSGDGVMRGGAEVPASDAVGDLVATAAVDVLPPLVGVSHAEGLPQSGEIASRAMGRRSFRLGLRLDGAVVSVRSLRMHLRILMLLILPWRALRTHGVGRRTPPPRLRNWAVDRMGRRKFIFLVVSFVFFAVAGRRWRAHGRWRWHHLHLLPQLLSFLLDLSLLRLVESLVLSLERSQPLLHTLLHLILELFVGAPLRIHGREEVWFIRRV
jgi:hypothetical protein